MKSGLNMKSGLIWMALAIAALVSTSAWAVWDPDADTALVFNMNFESYDNGTHQTTDADGGLVGTLVDYNDTYPNVFGETGAIGLGFDANFAVMHDNAPGAGVASNIPTPNDVRLTVPSTGIFDLGDVTNKHTWTFWFNVPSMTDGTIIRHADAELTTTSPDHTGLAWEIRIYGGVLQFYHKNNSLRFQTASSLSALGLTANTWHHVAVVIDRSNSIETSVATTHLSTKMYIDGLEVPVIVTYLSNATMNVDIYYDFYDSPLWIGAGERTFNGLLDEVRLFNRVLTPTEVSILNQPDTTQPIALSPIPRSSNVVMTTGLSWSPAPGATAQTVYFGTNTDTNLLPLLTSGSGSLNSATPSTQLAFDTRYYWYIKSTVDSVDSNGPVWSFTSETGKAINVSPIDGSGDANENFVDINWTTPSPATYAVYFSQDRSLVEASSVSVRVANGITDHNIIVTTGSRGTTYYWRVNSTYTVGGTKAGDIWSFRTNAYELVFNTSATETTYADHIIPAYTCLAHKDGWSDPCSIGSLRSDGVAEFNFPGGFNYDKRYDIIVVPQVRPEWVDVNTPTPLAIRVTGDFSFDGRVQIAGDDILASTQDIAFARSGGFSGPKHGQDSSVFVTAPPTGQPATADYWTVYTFPQSYLTRFNVYTSGSEHFIYVPTALALSTFGPGHPVNPPYKGGGGGGAGGAGGEAGRGFYFGVYSGGPSYGDKEVPVPFGGSSGGWGGTTTGGAAGGGGIEVVATGNVFLDVNSQILAHGGSQLCGALALPAGGGGGGSVKIIAGGSVTNKGIIDVNGGKGGDGQQANNNGGGGGGGRVAIFYGTAYSNTGTIAANGGVKGITAAGMTLAQNGQNGTIYVVNSSIVSPKKASAPTPANGDKMVYINHPDPCTGFQLKWYSGSGGTTDRVYCDTFTPPTTQRGTDVSATRGQHSVTMPSVSSGNTYYWKVVTDGTVSSDTWSFKTVNWRCKQYDGDDTDPNHLGGPRWDLNRDCVLDIQDLEGFADVWLNPAFDNYTVEFLDFAQSILGEWRQCINRTDGGCAGY